MGGAILSRTGTYFTWNTQRAGQPAKADKNFSMGVRSDSHEITKGDGFR